LSFPAALLAVSPPCRAQVEAQLAAWRGASGDWVRVAANIEHETALRVADFTSLLEAFGQALVAGTPAPGAWEQACRTHQFRGALIPAASLPGVLGRAMAVRRYADLVAAASGGQLTPATAEGILQRYAGRAPLPPRIDRRLREALVGQHVVWATFCTATPDVNPFDALSRTTQDILTAFGLGQINASETLVLIAYRSSTPTASPPVYRPTVAEAESFAYYRPWNDPLHPHGYTAPLPPNPANLGPQPEVVHRQIVGAGLLVPYYLTTP
jgi:hypothetical protein